MALLPQHRISRRRGSDALQSRRKRHSGRLSHIFLAFLRTFSRALRQKSAFGLIRGRIARPTALQDGRNSVMKRPNAPATIVAIGMIALGGLVFAVPQKNDVAGDAQPAAKDHCLPMRLETDIPL